MNIHRLQTQTILSQLCYIETRWLKTKCTSYCCNILFHYLTKILKLKKTLTFIAAKIPLFTVTLKMYHNLNHNWYHFVAVLQLLKHVPYFTETWCLSQTNARVKYIFYYIMWSRYNARLKPTLGQTKFEINLLLWIFR